MSAPIRLQERSAKDWPQDRVDFLRDREWAVPQAVEGLRYLQVELTNQCNLQCVECPQRLMTRPRVYMDLPTFETVLDLLERVQFETVIPHKDGESLLHPQYQTALALISRVQPETKFAIYTNGTHFTQAFYEFARTLPNRFQVLVSFHFQGYKSRKADCRDVVEYDTRPADDALLACLKDPAPNVELVLTSHVTPHSDPLQQDAWEARWRRIAEAHPESISAVHLNRDINPWAGHIDIGTTAFQVCPYDTGEHIFVGVTGTVLPCCMDLNEDLVVGSLTNDLDDILEYRARFYADVKIPRRRKPRCIACIGGD